MRQFIAENSLDINGCLFIEGKKFHYLSNVLRVACGNMISVRLPDGSLQQMTVVSVNQKDKNIILQVAGERKNLQNVKNTEKSSCEIWLFQFIAKPVKMELIVRQAVECGVSYIVPVEGSFSQSGAVKSAREASEGFGKGGRWDRIITEARQQSGSAVDTKILSCVTVEEACKLWQENCKPEESTAVALYEQTENTILLHETLRSTGTIKQAAVAVGSEGGISPEEINVLCKNGFKSIHFKTNILRCETAALYGIAAIQTLIAEKNIWQDNE